MPPEELLHPLAVDVLRFLTPLLIGIAAFFVGRRFHRWSMLVRAGLIGLTVGAIFVVLALLFHAIPRPIELAFSYVGGVIIVLCWMILGVIGFSWASPNPSSDVFARFFLGLMPLVLIGVESGGSLWFRFGNTDPWSNRADPQSWEGRMVQTTTKTCLPVAAAMLMHQYVDDHYSEGEMAYLANTSFFGTDGHVMARVITERINKPGVVAKMKRATYEEMVQQGAPFIAEVQLEKVGKHAVLVLTITENFLQYLDPLEAFPTELRASFFDRIWTGNVIVIEGMATKLKAS